jgi:hypothetical protein
MNYPMHDKELLAIVRALQYWRWGFVGLHHPFLVITDHKALNHFSIKRLLNIRQAGWAELMAQYHFTITYRPGVDNAAADALSRKAEDLKIQKAKKEAQRTMRIFKPAEGESDDEDAKIFVASIDQVDGACQMLVDDLLKVNRESPDLEVYRGQARNNSDGDFKLLEGRLLLKNCRLVVPDEDLLRARILQEAHDRITTAHPDRNKTRKLVCDRY